MITGDGVRRRALLGLPLVAALGGCAGDWDRVVGTPEPGDPFPPPLDDAPPDTTASEPAPTPEAPGAWAIDYPAATISLVRGFGLEEVLALFLDGRSAPRFGSIDEAITWVDADPDYMRVLGYASVVDGWTFVWEDNGFRGSSRSVATHLSRRGTFASMYWNVNANMRFTLARKGRVVRSFDPFALEQGSGAALPEEKGLDLTSEQAPAAELVLMSRLTGLPVVDSTWPERPGTVIFGGTV